MSEIDINKDDKYKYIEIETNGSSNITIGLTEPVAVVISDTYPPPSHPGKLYTEGRYSIDIPEGNKLYVRSEIVLPKGYNEENVINYETHIKGVDNPLPYKSLKFAEDTPDTGRIIESLKYEIEEGEETPILDKDFSISLEMQNPSNPNSFFSKGINPIILKQDLLERCIYVVSELPIDVGTYRLALNAKNGSQWTGTVYSGTFSVTATEKTRLDSIDNQQASNYDIETPTIKVDLLYKDDGTEQTGHIAVITYDDVGSFVTKMFIAKRSATDIFTYKRIQDSSLKFELVSKGTYNLNGTVSVANEGHYRIEMEIDGYPLIVSKAFHLSFDNPYVVKLEPLKIDEILVGLDKDSGEGDPVTIGSIGDVHVKGEADPSDYRFVLKKKSGKKSFNESNAFVIQKGGGSRKGDFHIMGEVNGDTQGTYYIEIRPLDKTKYKDKYFQSSKFTVEVLPEPVKEEETKE